jgi:hypothetical protein
MKLTGAIYQTNEAPTAGILGHHSHRSPAIWNQHLVPARKFNVELGTHDDIHSTAPMLRGEWSTKHLQYSILGLWSAHNSSLRPPHPAESNMVHDQCCASYAMPCVLAVTRFKSLSHRLDVDLSVLRANFTGWRRGSRLFEHLWATHPCICAFPPTGLIQPSRGHPNYHWTCIVLFQK